MWAFKTLHDKGLIYEGFRVLAYCWRCETPLSNTETRMDDVYKDRQDPALTVKFRLESGEFMVAWTTTPWTLPSNLALAVGADIDYAVLEQDGERYIIADALVAAHDAEFGDAERVDTLQGSDLVGRRYAPLFDYFTDTELHGTDNAWLALAAAWGGVSALAERCGVDRKTIYRWASGAREPRLLERQKLDELARRRGLAALYAPEPDGGR